MYRLHVAFRFDVLIVIWTISFLLFLSLSRVIFSQYFWLSHWIFFTVLSRSPAAPTPRAVKEQSKKEELVSKNIFMALPLRFGAAAIASVLKVSIPSPLILHIKSGNKRRVVWVLPLMTKCIIFPVYLFTSSFRFKCFLSSFKVRFVNFDVPEILFLWATLLFFQVFLEIYVVTFNGLKFWIKMWKAFFIFIKSGSIPICLIQKPNCDTKLGTY